MKPYLWILLALALVGLIITWMVLRPDPNAATTKEKCSDGRIVFRYKNPESAFPEFTRDYEASYQITTNLLGKLESDTSSHAISTGAKTIARVLIDTLNQQNIFYQTTLKAYFIESNNEPCDKELRDRYLSFINKMADDMMNMNKAVQSLAVPASAVNKLHDSDAIAVVDTAAKKVQAPTSLNHVAADKMIVLKDSVRINAAMENMAQRYKISPVLVKAVR